MAYSNYSHKPRGILFALRMKAGKWLAGHFPLNIVRVWGLRFCGFKVGRQVYVGQGLFIASMNTEDNCMLIIGDRVAIGPQVMLILSSDANYSQLADIFKPVRGTITLKSDCWIGARAVILPGIIINESAIVGAGAVVTHSVDSKTIVAGVPAKVLKRIG